MYHFLTHSSTKHKIKKYITIMGDFGPNNIINLLAQLEIKKLGRNMIGVESGN